MRRWVFLITVVAGCSAPPEAVQPEELPFAEAYLARTTAPEARVDTPPDRPLQPVVARAPEFRGLLEIDEARRDELRTIAGDNQALDALLNRGVSRVELETLTWIRSPLVRAARERVVAARTAYLQSADLRDLVALYRSYMRGTKTRVGPERSRRATASIAPSPNIDALSGLLIDRSVSIATEQLRRTIRDQVAAAERAHADAVRLVAARAVVWKDVELNASLVKVLRARLESGKSSQAALLAFQARLEALRTELRILDEQRASLLAQWNRLLSRPADASVNLDVSSSDPAATPPAHALTTLALVEQQSVRIATLRAERQAIAVRLAETMTLPRMDVGSSRFDTTSDTFPEPGRMAPTRWDFGVREAQVTEMRAREAAAKDTLDAARNTAQSDSRTALFALDAARRRWDVHRTELVPLAKRSFETTQGAYAGNRVGYIELLDRARELLRARLGLVDSRRDYSYARSRLLQAVGVRTPETRDTK